MSSNKIGLVFLFIVSLIFLNGCPCPCPPHPPGIQWIWYDNVSDELYAIWGMETWGKSILVFNNIDTANGHISPARTILPPVFHITNMWLDRASDQLFVISPYPNNSILVFTDATTMNGNVTPARVISGTTTALDHGPFYLRVDSNSNQLYVVNANQNILVFTDATTANGDVAPARRITLTTSEGYGWGCGWGECGWAGPLIPWFDATSDQLYLASEDLKGRLSILVFTDVSTMNGNVAPARGFSTTTSSFPTGLWLDSTSDQLYVETLDSILVFTDATTANGDVVPARRIIPTTNGSYPIPFWLDAASNQLYLVNYNTKSGVSILVFTDVSTMNGNVAPSRVLYP